MAKAEAAPANKSKISIEAVLTSTEHPMLFADLWLGDTFIVLDDPRGDDLVYTKTRHDQAREHSSESRKLKAEGAGFIQDAVITIKPNTIVRFIPLSIKVR